MDKNIIKKFIEDTKYISFSFEYEEDSGKIRVLDNHGYEISSESATVIIEGMTKAYINLSDVEINNIRKYNAENDLWNYSQSYGPRVLETLFRKNLKKDWGFTCIKCGKKCRVKVIKVGGEFMVQIMNLTINIAQNNVFYQSYLK